MFLSPKKSPKKFFQCSILSPPIQLPIPIVLVLHSPLTSRPSQIAGKEEELWIKKTQTLTTIVLYQIGKKQYLQCLPCFRKDHRFCIPPGSN